MPPNPDPPTTSVLFIDSSKKQRTYWAEQLKGVSPNYLIVEAKDRETALTLFRSRGFDCVVLELALGDQQGFQLLVDLVPNPRRPQVAVVVLTHMTQTGIWELARLNGAHGCLVKDYITGKDLDQAIQRAVAFVGQMPKEDRHRPH